MDDKVVEVGLQPDRGPALFNGPSAGLVPDRDTAHAGSGAAEPGAAADEDVAVRSHGRLHNAVARPPVLPEHCAVGGRDADRAGSIEQQNLCDSVDRHPMWRAVAPAAGRAEPAPIASGDVVGDERSRGGDDDDIVDHQWRAREAPARDFLAGVGRRVAGPHDRTVTGVERVQDPSRTKCVDATVAETRRPARTGAGV